MIILEVGDKFVTADDETWDDEFRNKVLTVEESAATFVTAINHQWKPVDINLEETKKLNLK